MREVCTSCKIRMISVGNSIIIARINFTNGSDDVCFYTFRANILYEMTIEIYVYSFQLSCCCQTNRLCKIDEKK
jgi:hypothetical protein